jgi:hypothetical protein
MMTKRDLWDPAISENEPIYAVAGELRKRYVAFLHFHSIMWVFKLPRWQVTGGLAVQSEVCGKTL